jgi:hypothetical protein
MPASHPPSPHAPAHERTYARSACCPAFAVQALLPNNAHAMNARTCLDTRLSPHPNHTSISHHIDNHRLYSRLYTHREDTFFIVIWESRRASQSQQPISLVVIKTPLIFHQFRNSNSFKVTFPTFLWASEVKSGMRPASVHHYCFVLVFGCVTPSCTARSCSYR